MSWVVVAFMLMSDGTASFYHSPSYGDHAYCERQAVIIYNSIDMSSGEIRVLSAACIPADRRHIPGPDET